MPTPDHPLMQLIRFRWGLLALEAAALLFAWLIDQPVWSWPLLLSLAVLHLLSNPVLDRLSRHASYPLRLAALALLLDIAVMTLQLAQSGGASNGLTAVLLLPVAVSAMLLPPLSSQLFAALAICCYSLLTQWQLSSNPHAMHHQSEAMAQHLQQMWWGFTVSALIVSWFISSQTQQIRRQNNQLAQLHHQQAQHEQLLVVATYAANAAHDLATPLQNLTLLADELQEHPLPTELKQDMLTQLDKCSALVQQLRHSAQQLRDEQPQDLTQLLSQSLQLWLVSRPEISASLRHQHDGSAQPVSEALSITAALFNVLDNAATASAQCDSNQLELDLTSQNGTVLLRIRDFGPGLSEQQLQQLGRVVQPSEQGLGLGQFLATVSLQRLGAQVKRYNLPEGGSCTEIFFAGAKTR
ncbi:HAMP domain-containing sensor histidine kinase [Rheinheimera sp.]|uniref:sensor histidine kinase n=1 Tax=Rheinheimera sp. TaxID=1869214 RepID=UPI00307E68CC